LLFQFHDDLVVRLVADVDGGFDSALRDVRDHAGDDGRLEVGAVRALRVGFGLDRDPITADLDQQVVELVLMHRAALPGRESQHPHADLVILEHDFCSDGPEVSILNHELNPKIRLWASTRPEAWVTGVVVVGTGFGCITHVRALRAAGFEVLGLVGRDPDKTNERARRFDVPYACTSVTEALALGGVDAVAIATPPHTHAKIALEAIAAGKHVLCEKPFARDAHEAASMCDAAQAADVVHFLGTEFRWASGQASMARVVARGEIGTPKLATFLMHIPMLADPDGAVPAWWADASQGGGWLGAQAAHMVDQVRVMLGEFEGVSASLTQVSARDWDVEDTFTVRFRTCSGVDGTMQSTVGAWGPPVFCTRVAGTLGTVWAEFDMVRVADAAGTRDVAVPADLPLAKPDPPPPDLLSTAYDSLHAFGIDLVPYTRLCTTFLDRIEGRAVPDDPRPATFVDGVAGMRVLDAIRQSARTRAWVTI
jgi:predicted dehydrogenase